MMFIFVNAASELKSVDDLVAGAKDAPGKFSFGAGTITSKLMGHLVNKTIGMETLLISYNGSAEVTQGLLTRSVDFTYDGPSAAMPLVQSGQFRILAKFDNRPFPPAPDVPTFARALLCRISMRSRSGSALSHPKERRPRSSTSSSARSRRFWPIQRSRRRPMLPDCFRSP